MKHKILFEEKQKFTQWWLWVSLICLWFIPIYGIYKQLILGKPFGDRPMSDIGLILFALSLLLVCILFWIMRLSTIVTEERLIIRYFPFLRTEFIWQDVEMAGIVKYNFLGYGIRVSLNHGTVYNMKGNKGLFLILKNGKKRLIGTQKPEELERVVKEITGKM